MYEAYRVKESGIDVVGSVEDGNFREWVAFLICPALWLVARELSRRMAEGRGQLVFYVVRSKRFQLS